MYFFPDIIKKVAIGYRKKNISFQSTSTTNEYFVNFSLDIDKKVLTFTLKTPRIDLKAKYSINGKVMVMPFFGNGDAVLTLCKHRIFNLIRLKITQFFSK